MARWASFCEIGNVSFTGCRVEIIDAGAFRGQNAGSVDWANDGTPHIQAVNRGVKGIQFGLKMVSAQGTKLEDVFSMIEIGEETQEGIVITATDGIFNIDIIAVADYTQEWFTFTKHSEGWYEDVTLRFISVEVAPLSQPSIQITACGTAGLLGIYISQGTYNGKEYYAIDGMSGNANLDLDVTGAYWNGTTWEISLASEGTQFYSDEDAEFIYDVATWGMLLGTLPAPTIIRL